MLSNPRQTRSNFQQRLFRFTSAYLLLICCNNSWAEPDYRDTPVLTLRAQLYMKIGDYYASRQEYERAAAAYLKAAELSAENLPQEQQLSISERLANVQKLGPAIDNLQTIRRAEPTNANARLMLARYLGWHNQPRESAIIADELMALQPDNLDARIIKATVSSWRGDYATAIPLFEEVLRKQEDFDTRLSYYHALSNVSHVIWRNNLADELKTENEFQQLALDDLRWALQRKSTPSLEYQYEFYDDSYKNKHSEQYLRFTRPWRDASTFLSIGRTEAADDFGYRFDLNMLAVGIEKSPGDANRLLAKIGITRYNDFDYADVLTSQLIFSHRLPDLFLSLEYEHEAYDDYTFIIFNNIRTHKLSVKANYQPSDFWDMEFNHLYSNYSDNNHSNETALTLRYAIHHTPPRISIAYKHERLAFATQTFNGYYDPDQANTSKLLVQIYQSGNRYETGAEIYSGHQDSQRLGFTDENSIIGWSAFYRLHLRRKLFFEVEWEGSNSSYRNPYGYDYNLISARAKFFL